MEVKDIIRRRQASRVHEWKRKESLEGIRGP